MSIPNQPNDVVKLTVERLSHEGRGIAHYPPEFGAAAGKTVFINFALPHETIEARIHKSHKRYDEADATELLSTASSIRQQPICQHFTQCGGCSLQHMNTTYQLELKQQALASQLTHFAKLAPEKWIKPTVSDKQDYRRKVRLGVSWDEEKKKLTIGFRKRQTNQLTEITHCAILEQDINQHLLALHQQLQQLTTAKHITYIELMAGDNEIAMLLAHVQPLSADDQSKIAHFCRARQWQLYLQPSNKNSRIKRLDQVNQPMRLHYRLPDFNLNFAFFPTDFIQVNALINQKLVSKACQLLDLQKGESVLDLFCGLGNFALAMATRVGANGKVIAIEGSQDMTKRATENAQLNRLKNLEFYAHDLNKDLTDCHWAKQKFDAILIDPPRAGAEKIVSNILQFDATRIVYISCDTATLARDSGILMQYGYRLKEAGILDMFQHTTHIESIALFCKD